VHVVGEGYGGLVALAMQDAAPERVASLVLLAPVVPGSLTAVQHGVMEQAVEDWRGAVDLIASSAAVTLNPQELARLGRDIGHTTRAAALGQLAALDDPESLPGGRRTTCAVLLVSGDYDGWTTRAAIRNGLLTVLPPAMWTVLPEVGRRVGTEATNVVAGRIADWIRHAEEPEVEERDEQQNPDDAPPNDPAEPEEAATHGGMPA
jgi:pimeloyl-ACP methyl ester carboxylesterase